MKHPLPVKPIGKYQDRDVECAWLVTDENLSRVAEWCGGKISPQRCGPMIAFPIRGPWIWDCCECDGAFAGDYMLKYADGFESASSSYFLLNYRLMLGPKPLCIDGHAYRRKTRKR